MVNNWCLPIVAVVLNIAGLQKQDVKFPNFIAPFCVLLHYSMAYHLIYQLQNTGDDVLFDGVCIHIVVKAWSYIVAMFSITPMHYCI